MTMKAQIPTSRSRIRVALVVPHIFMSDGIRENVIFSPGELAISLCSKLPEFGVDVTLFCPGKVEAVKKNIVADMTLFEKELSGRGYGYLELLKKHPLVFISLARQVQAEVISKAYEMANRGMFDVVHVYTNEEDIALQFASLCTKPVVFTHHDPFNFLIRYKSVFPKYRHLNYISMSMAQRKTMPEDTNWVANIGHGLDPDEYEPNYEVGEYLAYLGRIIEPKGVHLAVTAVKEYNESHTEKLKLKIAGRYYGEGEESYYRKRIEPFLDENIEYIGFLKGREKIEFLRGARALIVPSVFEEPFGMVTIEALACGTPVIGFKNGATVEIIENGLNGLIVEPDGLKSCFEKIKLIDRKKCRKSFENGFTLAKMAESHTRVYRNMC